MNRSAPLDAFDALTGRLEARAIALAVARARNAALKFDSRRWRRARLVWPLFGEG